MSASWRIVSALISMADKTIIWNLYGGRYFPRNFDAVPANGSKGNSVGIHSATGLREIG